MINPSVRNVIPQHKVFSSAGTVEYFGQEFENDVVIKLIQYNSEELEVHPDVKLLECKRKVIDKYVNWIDVTGIHQAEVIDSVGKAFGLHALLIEDILNTTQKPKFEYFDEDGLIFLILKVPRIEGFNIDFEHIALVFSENFVLSFQEMDKNDVFEPILTRLSKTPSKTRKQQSDYLFYSMIDIVVDNYYLIANKIEEILGQLEFEILNHAKVEHQKKLFFLKKEIVFLKKSLMPTKELLNLLIRENNNLINKDIKIYLRDVHDHVVENIESADSFRDEIENLIANYHAQLSDRMNSVMKTLTVFTSIFMPLTFIAGIYGMNFKIMPELEHPHGYFYTLAAMLVIGIGLWVYFKWKKYI